MTEIALLIGGAVGGFLRMLLEVAMPRPGQFPLGTFGINMVGSFILAFFYEVAKRRNISPHFRAGFGTGLIGAFTTFSTYCLDTSDLLTFRWLFAIIYGIGSLIGGLVFAAAGERLADWLWNGLRTKEEWSR